MKKILWTIGIIILILIILVAVIVGWYLGPIVKIGMEQIGPQVTKVPVTVDAVSIFPLTGSATIKNFVLGNPPGYKATQAISVGTVAVSMAPLSVMSKKILIHSIKVESPEITLEGGLGSNNLTKIMNNVNGTSQAPSNSPVNTTTATGKPQPAPNIEVDDFLISGAKVHVYLPALGEKDLSIPDIHLTDLGKGSNGLTPAELSRQVLSAISSATIKQVAASAGNLAQDVQNLTKGTGKGVGNSINQIANGITGLFGK